jgi:DNA-binding transcriptional ArsR family regulator
MFQKPIYKVGKWRRKMFNKIFGPSIYLRLLDLFIENPEKYMNVREMARRINKNPGSVSRALPRLLEKELLEQIHIGKNMYAYHLNDDEELIHLLVEFHSKLQNLKRREKGV